MSHWFRERWGPASATTLDAVSLAVTHAHAHAHASAPQGYHVSIRHLKPYVLWANVVIKVICC